MMKFELEIQNISFVNPYHPGFFGQSIAGGVECARRSFWDILSLFFITNQPNKVSNESWHLYIPVESLNTILSCIVLPWGGTEVDYFTAEIFSIIFENWSFFVLHGQYVHQMKAGNILHSNLTLKNGICFEKNCEK